MNKKILFFLIFVATIITPLTIYAINTPKEMAVEVTKLMWFIGTAIVVIGWTFAGIMFLLSAGSPEKTATAKKAVIAAVIGTVLVVIAGAGYAGVKTFIEPIIGK